MSKLLISIFIDGKPFKNTKFSRDSNLASIRQSLSLAQDIFFLNENNIIDISQENTIFLQYLKIKY